MSACCNNGFKMIHEVMGFKMWLGLIGPPGPQGPAGPPGTSVELRGPVETTGDLPATASSSELWLVGAAAPYHGWFYNGSSWEDAGEIAVGPTGPQGPAGQDGTDGADGVTFTPTVSSAGVISWTNDGSLPNPDPVDIKGPQGETGAAGSDGSNGVTFTPAVSSAGVISWTNDGGLPNPDSVNIKGPQGQTGQTGPAGQDGTDGSNGATFTPTVSSAGVISWTNDGGLPNPESVNIKGPQGPQGETGATGPQGPQGATGATGPQGPQGATGATGATGPGVPTGGTAGQVLTKTGAADYATGWQNPSGGDVTADMLGIVIDGNSTPVGASVGQYVIVKDSTISGITDGLYTAAKAIPANTAIDSTYLTAVSSGGLNDLHGLYSSLENSVKVVPFTITQNSTYINAISAITSAKMGRLAVVSLTFSVGTAVPNLGVLFNGLPKPINDWGGLVGQSGTTNMRVKVTGTTLIADGPGPTGWYSGTLAYITYS